jgi:hypothetical protein
MTFFAQVVVVRADSLEHADMLLWRKLHSDDDVPFVGDPWEVTPTNPLDELDAKHPATTFLIVAKYEHSRSVLIEHEDLAGSGLLLLTANGKLHEAPPVLP